METDNHAQTLQTSTHCEASQSLENKQHQIYLLCRQSFDVFNTYGKDPKALQSMVMGFYQILAPYSVDSISKAFGVWMEDRATMPTPADIKAIILSNKPLAPYKPPEGNENPSYKDLPPDEQKAIDDALAAVKRNLGREVDCAAVLERKVKNDYTHWNKSSEQARAKANKELGRVYGAAERKRMKEENNCN